LKRANFANPNAWFSSSNFARILSAKDFRITQLAAKFVFEQARNSEMAL
jgi:hypothetical protein